MTHACFETVFGRTAGQTPCCAEAGHAATPGATAALPQDRALRPPGRHLIESTVAQVFGVHAEALLGMSRGKAQVAQARQVAMYLTHIVFGMNLTDTGKLFGRDRTTVAHACSVVEDLRDDPVFDRVLELLEGVVEALFTPRDHGPLHN